VPSKVSGKLIKNGCFAVKKVSKTALKSVFAFPFARTINFKNTRKGGFWFCFVNQQKKNPEINQGFYV